MIYSPFSHISVSVTVVNVLLHAVHTSEKVKLLVLVKKIDPFKVVDVQEDPTDKKVPSQTS